MRKQRCCLQESPQIPCSRNSKLRSKVSTLTLLCTKFNPKKAGFEASGPVTMINE